VEATGQLLSLPPPLKSGPGDHRDYYAPPKGGIKRYPSVCLSHGAAAVGAQLP